MSELRVDSVKSKGGGAPNLPKGVTISGIATAATLGATTVDVSNVMYQVLSRLELSMVLY